MGGSNHFSPTHNGLPSTKLPAYNRSYPSYNHQHMEDTVYNPQVYSQGYLSYPTASISSASSTSHNSQYQHVYTPKVSCPMAKVAPYSAQVNRVVTLPTSSSSISADSTSYHDMADRDAHPHMMLQQMKAMSLGEDGMYGLVDGANYGSKWNGLIELKDQIMMQKDQLVERYNYRIVSFYYYSTFDHMDACVHTGTRANSVQESLKCFSMTDIVLQCNIS